MKNSEIKHINLKTIKNPDFLRQLSYKELDVLSDDIRKEIINITSLNGGHLSSNLGAVESTIALCRVFDFSKDKIFFDVGHQTYTYKILTGRNLSSLRTKGGLSGFQKPEESPYDHFSAGHSSTSIALANGFAVTRDLNKQHFDCIAYIGDASITNGLAFEAINDIAAGHHKVIIVLNDNDMSISRPVGGLSNSFRKFSTSKLYLKGKKAYIKALSLTKIGHLFFSVSSKIKNFFKRHLLKLNMFDSLGFSCIGPIDGHDIKALEKAFLKAKELEKSVVIHIKTIKGKGYSYAENDIEGKWHGVSPFKIETGESKKPSSLTWPEAFSSSLLKVMDNNEKIITIVPGTSLGSGMDVIKNKHSKRFIDVGIAEEYALTLSAAIANNGYHPVISIYSTFLQRAYDELSHDLARSKNNATILIDRAGLVGSDGETHQGIYDEAYLLSIPNVSIAQASHVGQIDSLIKESLNNHGVVALRYSKDKALNLNKNEDVPFGGWNKLLDGNDIAVISVGQDTYKLYDLLKDKNIALYNAIYLKPIDSKYIKELLAFKKIIIFDPYGTKEGFASYLSLLLIESHFKGEIALKCLPNEFIKQATIEEQKADLGIVPEEVIKII